MVKVGLSALAFVLVAVNWSIFDKERHLTNGDIVYFELAPVDPRSLMQGDYMQLNFKLSAQIRVALKSQRKAHITTALQADDDFFIAKRDALGVGHFSRLFQNDTTASDELKIHFRIRNNQIKFATNAFFFQEGDGEKYEAARYGQFRINKDGKLLLTGLHDKALNRL